MQITQDNFLIMSVEFIAVSSRCRTSFFAQ